MNCKPCIMMSFIAFAVVLNGCSTGPVRIGADQLENEGKLTEAVDSYRQEMIGAGRQKRQELRVILQRLTRQIVDQAFNRMGPEPQTADQFQRAIEHLEPFIHYDDADKRIAERIALYQEKIHAIQQFESLLQRAGTLMNEKKFSESCSQVQQALELNPQNKTAIQLKQEILKAWDETYILRIRQYLEREDWAHAESLCKTWNQEHPGARDETLGPVKREIARVKEAVIGQQLEHMIEQNKYFTALEYLKVVELDQEQALEWSADGHATVLDIDELRKKGGDYYLQKALAERDNLRYFHAYAAVVKALELLKKEPPEIFDLHRYCSDIVDDSIQLRLAIEPFASPDDDPEVGVLFSDRLMDWLYEQGLPYGLRFDERRKLEWVIDRQQGNTKSAVRLMGLDRAVFGTLRSDITRSESKRNITQWVPIRKTLPNPHYETEIKILAEKIGPDQALWPNRPEPFIQQELTERVTVSETTTQLEGVIQVSVDLYSAESDSVIKTKTFRTEDHKTCTIRDQVLPDVSEATDTTSPEQVISVESESVFEDRLQGVIFKDVSNWIMAQLRDRQKHYCEQALGYRDRREYDRAVHAAVQGYYYCLMDTQMIPNPEQDEWFRQLRELALFELTEGQ